MNDIDHGVLLAEDLKLLQPTLYSSVPTLEEFHGSTTALFEFMADNKLDQHIQGVHPLEEVVRAHGDLEGGKTMRK